MPLYSYQAVDTKGRRLTGRMPATSEAALEQKLKQNEAWLVEAKLHKNPLRVERATRSREALRNYSVDRRELIDLCTLMSFQVKVGVPLLQALEVAHQDCESPALRQVLGGLQRQIESGSLFYEALEQYPRVFTPHFVSVIRAGETSSKLPEAFADLRDYLEWVDRIAAEVRQASLYPAIILSVVSAFVIGLFVFIIPRFEALLKSTNAELPLVTQIVFGISDFLKETWWIWILIGPVLVASLLVSRSYSKRVALWYDMVKLKLPIFGELNWMLAITRFTHNLAMLYRAGIPILQSLHLCQGLIGNLAVKKAVLDVEEAVKAGSTISEALRRYSIFPPLLLRMTVMGETTGNLDHALENVSQYYGEIIPRRIKRVLTILEPALTIFMIAVVALVAISIYLPILTLMGSIKG